jgi:hypothetical protein
MRNGRWCSSRSTVNSLDPNFMTPTERITELAEILARALIRPRPRQSSRISADDGDSPLDCAAIQSGHGPELDRKGRP